MRPDPSLLAALLPLAALSLGCAAPTGGGGGGAGEAAEGDGDGGAGGGTGGGAGGGAGERTEEPALVAAALGEDDGADLRAPGRGLAPAVDLLASPDALDAAAGAARLVYAPVGLGAFRGGPIDAATLDALQAGLRGLEARGLHAILRFHHARPGDGTDAPATVIATHLAQLGPLLADAPAVLIVQAGFLGDGGGWTDSAHGHLDSAAVPSAVVEALLAALPPEVPLQVRTPAWKLALTGGPVTVEQAFSGAPAARTGHHNDCVLGSDTDGGTYPPEAVAEWTAFVTGESRFVPVGGALCAANLPRTDCAAAHAELSALGFVYLAGAPHPEVWAAWEAGGCAESLAARLGHRLVVTAAQASAEVAPGGLLRVVVDLENTGFAPTVRAQDVALVVGTASGAEVLPLPFVDTRRLAGGARLRLDLGVRVPAGTDAEVVSLALRLSDPLLPGDPRAAVPLGGALDFDPSSGDNLLFPSVPVRARAPGAREPTADTWALAP